MNVAALLQDSPSDDHRDRRRQELRDRESEREREREREHVKERERERERDREREKDKEWERSREWERERREVRERDNATSSSSSSAAATPGTRSYSPLGSSTGTGTGAGALPHRTREKVPPPRTGPGVAPAPPPSGDYNDGMNTSAASAFGHPHSFGHRPLGRARADSNPYAAHTHAHSHSHSPPQQHIQQQQQQQPPLRQRSSSGTTTRPRSPSGYNNPEFRDARGSAQSHPHSHSHSPTGGQTPYSVVPPTPPHHHHLSPPLSTMGVGGDNGQLRQQGSRAGVLGGGGMRHEEMSSSSRQQQAPPQSSTAASSPSSTMFGARDREYPRERERTLKEDIERERDAMEREQRELQRRAAAAGRQFSQQGSPSMDRRERDVDSSRLRPGDAQGLGGPQRELHHSRPGHQSSLSSSQQQQHPSHGFSSEPPLRQHGHPSPHPQQQQQQQHPPALPALPNHAPKSSNRAGVLKLAPPGVTVPNNATQNGPGEGSSAGGGFYARETLTLAPPSHTSTHPNSHHVHPHQQQPSHASPPLAPDRLAVEPPYTSSHAPPPPPSSKKSTGYTVVPTGPGVPPPGSAGMVHPQQQPQPQPKFGTPMSGHPPPHMRPSHNSVLPPPPPMPSGSTHAPLQSMHPYNSNNNRPTQSSLPAPPSMYVPFNEVPPLPVPLALQPMPPASPPSHELEPPIELGTFVYPRVPFPYFFPSSENQNNLKQPERSTQLTILVPSTCLPTTLPASDDPRIWGGGVDRRRPNVSLPMTDPYASYYNHGPSRRIYTDDSDLVLCALHSGFISWSAVHRARESRLDLALRLALHAGVRSYVGCPNLLMDEVHRREEDRELRLLSSKRTDMFSELAVQDGRMLLESGSWDSGHDGSGMEVLFAEWLPQGTARHRGLRNRSQRLREYGERRRVLMKNAVPTCSSSTPSSTASSSRPALGKRRQSRRLNLSSAPLALSTEEQELAVAFTLSFGKCLDWVSAGYNYDPSTVRSILFPTSSSSVVGARRRKRRRLDDNRSMNEIMSPEDDDTDDTLMKSKDKIILENNGERFMLIASDESGPVAEANKENVEQPLQVDQRYDLYILRPQAVSSKVGATVQASGMRVGAASGDNDSAKTSADASSRTNGASKQVARSVTGDMDPGSSMPALPSPTSVHASPKQERAPGRRTSLAALIDGTDENTNIDPHARDLEDDGFGSTDVKRRNQHPSGMPTPPLTTSESLNELASDKEGDVSMDMGTGAKSRSDFATGSASSAPTRHSKSTGSTQNLISQVRARSKFTRVKDLGLTTSIDSVRAELLFAKLGAERLQFIAGGVSVLPSEDVAGGDVADPTFVRVQRWRYPTSLEAEVVHAQ